jgi:hypothetical protein
MIGRHISVQAWKEKKEIDVGGKCTLEEALRLAALDQK